MLFNHGETLTLITKTVTGRDSYGNVVYGSTTADIPNCPVWPRTSSELVQGQDTVIAGVTAMLPAGTDVKAIDAIGWNGDTYQVDGQPGLYTSPFTGLDPGIEVQLTKVTG